MEMGLQKFGDLWVCEMALIRHEGGRIVSSSQSEGSVAREDGRTSSGDFSLPNEAACAPVRAIIR